MLHYLWRANLRIQVIGLKRGKSSEKFLDWWMTKLYRDCVVDIPRGLFVDQKWIDLVPGFFSDSIIIRDPSYNVAYWNLHEREFSGGMNNWKVDGTPLAFFHFSGYTPISPHILSKHQNRHKLSNLPELKSLTDLYSDQLILNGYEESSSWPYAFETLSNGVRLPMIIVRDVMQWAASQQLSTPSPIESPDDFCRFLMSRGTLADNPNVVVLYWFLLKRRQDVADAYPSAIHNSDDNGFRAWLINSGSNEESISDLLCYENEEDIVDYVADAFNRLRIAKRDDVFEEFDNLWSDERVFDEFSAWFSLYGIEDMGFQAEHTKRIRNARGGPFRILNIYFLRGDLQIAFPSLWEDSQIKGFSNS
ncbi:MAG: hypothetical protein WCH35_17930 [Comamonadaceae bacterium]